jgi:hypothetical protein
MRCVASDARLAALPRVRLRPAPTLRPARTVNAPRAGLPYLHFHLGLPALREPGSGDHAMAWRSHGSDNSSLIDALKRNKVIKDERCVTPRAHRPRGPALGTGRREGARGTISHALTLL